MKVFFFGLGYCAEALIRRTPSIEPSGTARTAAHVAELRARDVEAYAFDGVSAQAGVEDAIAEAEAIVVSIPPQEDNGPLPRFAAAMARAKALRRIVYYSTIGVYGDHGGRWVDEESATLTRSPRGLARLAEEARWRGAGRAAGAEVDVLRLPGIYGPGRDRNAIARLAAGEARRIVKPGYVSNRAHVDDIAEVARLVLERGLEGRIWNVADDEPSPPEDVIVYAASLLGVAPPPEEPFDPATMSPLAASFYLDSRRVSNAKAKRLLGFAPTYPSYRDGLKALFEAGEGAGQRKASGQSDA